MERIKKIIVQLACCMAFLSCHAPQNISNKIALSDFDSHIESYAFLHAGGFTGKPVPQSPDPLVAYRWAQEDSNLQVYQLKPIHIQANHSVAFENIQSAKSNNCNILVRDTGSLQFDFGVESAGWLEFDSPDLDGAVTLSISEYNQPAIVNRGPKHPEKTAVPVKHGNTYRLELNQLLYEGVRFGWIHSINVNKPWHITAVRLVCQVKPTNYTGSFSCSDAVLTKIWYTGAYTVKLNFLKDYFGAILMDRGDRYSWTGDAHTAQAASLVAFSNYAAIKNNIERTRADNNSIETYSLYWILSLLDYFYYTGDAAFFNSLVPVVEQKMQHAATVYNSKAPLGFAGWDERLGAGFENPDNSENWQLYNMLFLQTCNVLADALPLINQSKLAATYKAWAFEKVAALRQDKQWFKSLGLHASADAVNAGFLNAAEKQSLIKQRYRDSKNTISFSPFNQYFIIRSMATLGLYNEALAAIDQCWGGQLQLGGTTFWECYRPEWNRVIQPNDPVPNGQCGYTSLCHPWSSGVTKWLSEEVLGIKPTAPGFKTFNVVPHVSGGLTWVRGNTTTPLGVIEVYLDLKKGKATLQSPSGAVGMFAIPKAGRKIKSITINNQLAWNNQFQAVSGIATATEDSAFIYFQNMEPGRYDFSIAYDGDLNKLRSQKSAVTYPATLVNIDRPAHRDLKKFGKEGYILFNYYAADKHAIKWPEYIDSVQWKTEGVGNPRSMHKAVAAASFWAPVDVQKRDSVMTGALTTRNPNACFQTFYTDILSHGNSAYQFTLYFADINKEHPEFIIDLFDYETKNIICPSTLVQNIGKGTYVTYQYNRPVRVRISHVQGGDALLNGIFFIRS